MGHVLGTGTLTPTEATDVAAELMAERMLGTYGIVTLSEDNGGYNPIGYHTGSIWTHDSAICAWGLARERQDAAAAEVARRLLDLAEVFDYRVPELCADEGVLGRPAPYPASCRPQAWSCAAMVGLLTTALGLSVDVPGRSITVRPSQPAPFGALTVGGIRVGDARVTISTDREGGVTVVGLPPGFVVRH
jgi:glycogen debranching enzyme